MKFYCVTVENPTNGKHKVYLEAAHSAAACKYLINKGYRTIDAEEIPEKEFRKHSNKYKTPPNKESSPKENQSENKVDINNSSQEPANNHDAINKTDEQSTLEEQENGVNTKKTTINDDRNKLSYSIRENGGKSNAALWAIAAAIGILAYIEFSRENVSPPPMNFEQKVHPYVKITDDIIAGASGNIYEIYDYGGSRFIREIRFHDWDN